MTAKALSLHFHSSALGETITTMIYFFWSIILFAQTTGKISRRGKAGQECGENLIRGQVKSVTSISRWQQEDQRLLLHHIWASDIMCGTSTCAAFCPVDHNENLTTTSIVFNAQVLKQLVVITDQLRGVQFRVQVVKKLIMRRSNNCDPVSARCDQ